MPVLLVRIYRQLSPSFTAGHEWKCKHHYHFQTTAITTLFFGNVDQSSCQAETRQMIFSNVLTDYIHATLKCPGSCCWYYYTLFQTFDTSEELNVCLCYNYWRSLILGCAITWREQMTAGKCDVTAVDILRYFTNSDFCHITGGESLYFETVFQSNNQWVNSTFLTKVVLWFHLTSGLRIAFLTSSSLHWDALVGK